MGTLVPAPAGASAPSAISLASFLARLESTRALAEADASAPSPDKMQALRAALGFPVDVEVGGRVVHIGPDDELAGLKGSKPGDFRRAADHLAAMEDGARAAAGAQPPSLEAMAAALRGAYVGINATPTWFARVRHDIWVIFLSLWERVKRLMHGVPGPRWLGGVVAIAVVGLVIAVILWRLRYVVPERGARRDRPGKAPPPDWDRLAEEALARGDLVGAVRARYRAIQAVLAARGVIPDSPSVTAGETRRAVAGDLPAAYPSVARAADIFEATLYGHVPVTPGEVQELATAEQSVGAV
jgi:hypothetical protein